MKIGFLIRESVRVLRIDRLLYHLTKGKAVGSLIGKITPEFYQYPRGTSRTVKREGLKYCLDLSDYQEWLVYFGFTNDSPEGLAELTEAHFNMIDVGANIGQTSLKLSKLISPSNTIWAFEPDRSNYQKLVYNIQLNGISNILPFNVGLGSYLHTAAMEPEIPGNRGGCRIIEDLAHAARIQIITIDEFVKQHNCQVSLIKMDVEGYEYEVVKGAAATIATQHPMLFVELDDDHLKRQGSSARELVEFLIGQGYFITQSHTNLPVNAHTDFVKCHYDIICKFVT